MSSSGYDRSSAWCWASSVGPSPATASRAFLTTPCMVHPTGLEYAWFVTQHRIGIDSEEYWNFYEGSWPVKRQCQLSEEEM